MGFVARVELDVSGLDPTLVAERAGDMTDFHRNVNVLLLQRASQRLASRVKGDIRTGNLLRSLAIGGTNNINELGQNFGEVGSALEYAAKVNEGGMIYPSQTKALAVPVGDKAKRYGLWPRDVDPNRELLQLIPRKGKPPLLINPQDDGEAWVLMPAVNWGQGYHYLEFRSEDIADIQELFYEHLEMEG